MFDFFMHRFFGQRQDPTPPAAQGPDIAPLSVVSPERRATRQKLEIQCRQDLAEHRKQAWLKTIRPRLTRGKSGFWWCVSRHKTPDGLHERDRIGSGRTPREAYDAWMNY